MAARDAMYSSIERVREAVASVIAVGADDLRDRIGPLVIADAGMVPGAAAGQMSAFDPESRTLTLIADHIPAGYEKAAVAAEMERWHGDTVRQVVGEDLDLLQGRQEGAALTLQAFRASRRYTDDIGALLAVEEERGTAGFVYPGGCYITVEASGYYLGLGSQGWKDVELKGLEAQLYGHWYLGECIDVDAGRLADLDGYERFKAEHREQIEALADQVGQVPPRAFKLMSEELRAAMCLTARAVVEEGDQDQAVARIDRAISGVVANVGDASEFVAMAQWLHGPAGGAVIALESAAGSATAAVMSVDEYFESLAPGQRPVFDASRQGFVMHDRPELGRFPFSYKDAVAARAASSGVMISDMTGRFADGPSAYNARLRSALRDAMPLVEKAWWGKGRVSKLQGLIATEGDSSRKLGIDLMFAAREVWPLVHFTPDEKVSEDRRRLHRECVQILRTDVPHDPYDMQNQPLAAEGLTSYRCKGAFGWIMIGGTDPDDAMREARRSYGKADRADLEVWNGRQYVPCVDPLRESEAHVSSGFVLGQ